MTIVKTRAGIATAARVHRFTYAIRNIVAEAQKVEAAGTRVRYLNIGDPVAFGFHTPPHPANADPPTNLSPAGTQTHARQHA